MGRGNNTADSLSSGLSSVAISNLDNGTDGELITWNSSGVAATVAVGTINHVLTSNGAGAAPTFKVIPSGGGSGLTSVAISDLDNGTDGELITWDASGVATTIAVGTANHVLTSNGVGAAPTFQVAASGGLTSVAVSDLDNGTDGELITWDASGVATTVAVGTSGHVLTSNGAGAAPTFQAGGGGSSAFTTGAATYVNNQSTATDITGMVFNKASIRGAEIFATTFTDSTYGDKATVSTLNILSDGVNWVIIEDTKISTVSTNIVYSITSAGQVQYTSPNDGGFTSGTIKWLYGTTPV